MLDITSKAVAQKCKCIHSLCGNIYSVQQCAEGWQVKMEEAKKKYVLHALLIWLYTYLSNLQWPVPLRSGVQSPKLGHMSPWLLGWSCFTMSKSPQCWINVNKGNYFFQKLFFLHSLLFHVTRSTVTSEEILTTIIINPSAAFSVTPNCKREEEYLTVSLQVLT